MPTCAIVCCSSNDNKTDLENTMLSMLQWTREKKFVTTIYCFEKFIEQVIVKQHVLDTDLMVFDLLLFPNTNEAKSFYKYHQPRILSHNFSMFHNYFVKDMEQKLQLQNRRQYVLRFPNLINIFTIQQKIPSTQGVHFIVFGNTIEMENTQNITYVGHLSLEQQHVICACCDYTTSQTMSYNCLTRFSDNVFDKPRTNNENFLARENIPISLPEYHSKTIENPFHFNHMHQVWLSNNPIRPNNMYHDHNQVKWKSMNPEVEFKLWHKLDIIDLIKTHYDDNVLDCFESLTPFICKCDFARLLIVYIFGGFYTDVDFIPIKPIKEWCPIYDSSGFLLFAELIEHSDSQLCNGFFGAEKPRHPFLKALIDFIIKNEKSHGDVMGGTGPKLWSKMHTTEFSSIIVQNGAYVMPLTDHHVLSRDFQDTCWTYTEWTTGSGWGSGIENRNIILDKTNRMNLTEVPSTNAWFIVFIVEITLIILVIIIWVAIEMKLYRTQEVISKSTNISFF
jgi:mannosyltransferase OCH1-like enzyme